MAQQRHPWSRRAAVTRLTALLLVAWALASTPPVAAQDAQKGNTPATTPTIWAMRMERSGALPRVVTGLLALDGDGTGSLNLDQLWGAKPERISVSGSGPRKKIELHLSTAPTEARAWADLEFRETTCVGTFHWEFPQLTEECDFSGRRVEDIRPFEEGTPRAHETIGQVSRSARLRPGAFARLILTVERRDSEALYISVGGKVVCDRSYLRRRRPLCLYSVTKAVASFAVPLLIEDGLLPRDLDTPIATWLPAFKDDPSRSAITLRHILTHTTGLDADRTSGLDDAKDQLAFAQSMRSVAEPGTDFAYNNCAFELLTGVVEATAKESLATYLRRRLLTPLGLQNVEWPSDAEGNTPTYSRLFMTADELARIGELVLTRGRVGDRQLVPAWWFDEIVKASQVNQDIGTVWWLWRRAEDERVVQTKERIDWMSRRGISSARRLLPLVGRSFTSRQAWWEAVAGVVGGDECERIAARLPSGGVGGVVEGPVTAVYHSGTLGQYLVVVPNSGVVAVRLREGAGDEELTTTDRMLARMQDFPQLVSELPE